MNNLKIEEAATKINENEFKTQDFKIKELEQKIIEIKIKMETQLKLMDLDEIKDLSTLLQHSEQYIWFALQLEPLLFELQRALKIKAVS